MATVAPCTVLVIDDERGPRESLRILLKNEYEVYCASSVDEGLAQLREQHPDVVVMDIRMPVKSGIQGLKEIRREDPLISIIMLTGYGTLETAQQALRLGANDYIKKPFDTHQMLQLIRRYTKRTRNERHRHDAVHNVEQVNRQLMEEVTQMEQMASMGKVSAEFAHDLKNPLTIVMGYVELLAEQLQSVRYILGEHYGETEKYLEVIEQNVERCQELACMWQRMGKDKQHYPEAVDVAALVAEMKTGVEFLAVHDHANIEYDLGLDHGVMVWGCRVELMRAFHNIVTNAIHAVAEQRGTVCIQTREVADEIEFTVRDTGGGIHPDHLQTIFEPYFTTKKAGKGTGLGLAITKKIIETCKGRIEVDSAPGQGTVMTVRLPRMSSQSHSNAVANEIHTPLHYAAV